MAQRGVAVWYARFLAIRNLNRCLIYPAWFFLLDWLQVSVVDELGIPVKFIGVGEGMEDLQPFDAEAFVEAIFPWIRIYAPIVKFYFSSLRKR